MCFSFSNPSTRVDSRPVKPGLDGKRAEISPLQASKRFSQELSERLLVTKGNVCMTLQAMEAEGLVERRTDAADQRANRLYMTNAGRQRLAKTKPALEALMARMLGVLSSDEQRLLRRLLGRIEQTFDDIADA